MTQSLMMTESLLRLLRSAASDGCAVENGDYNAALRDVIALIETGTSDNYFWKFHLKVLELHEAANNRDSDVPVTALGPDGVQDRLNWVFKKVGGIDAVMTIGGVTRSTVYVWRKSGARIPLDTAAALTKEAGVTLDWLIEGR